LSNPLDSELIEWKQHPFTQRFMQYLFWCREINKEDWAKGCFVGGNLEEMALANAKALGGVEMIEKMLSVDMQAIISMETESHEYVRNQSSRLDGTGKTG
jgi:hypothetical protein